jgi:hypothetical protein
MARVILVSALITAVHPLWTMQGVPEQTELAFAFLIGFFPELGLRALRQGLAGVVRALLIGTDERFPLRQLDGVTIWVQARFLEEGIEDMQNLATANLVDLMLYTRMPISRLVDWMTRPSCTYGSAMATAGHPRPTRQPPPMRAATASCFAGTASEPRPTCSTHSTRSVRRMRSSTTGYFGCSTTVRNVGPRA